MREGYGKICHDARAMPSNATWWWKRMKQMAEDANSLPINRVEYNDLSVGFITNGIAYQYVKEAMPQASVLKLGLLNPFQGSSSRNLQPRWIKLYIFEELEPVVEEQVKSWGHSRKAVGKEIFTVQGEYSANLIRERVLGQTSQVDEAAQVPARPPSCVRDVPTEAYTLCLTS